MGLGRFLDWDKQLKRSNDSGDAGQFQWRHNYIICLPVRGTCRFNGYSGRVYYARGYAHGVAPSGQHANRSSEGLGH